MPGRQRRAIEIFVSGENRKEKSEWSEVHSDVELVMGLEPAACSLRMSCSTN